MNSLQRGQHPSSGPLLGKWALVFGPRKTTSWIPRRSAQWAQWAQDELADTTSHGHLVSPLGNGATLPKARAEQSAQGFRTPWLRKAVGLDQMLGSPAFKVKCDAGRNQQRNRTFGRSRPKTPKTLVYKSIARLEVDIDLAGIRPDFGPHP